MSLATSAGRLAESAKSAIFDENPKKMEKMKKNQNFLFWPKMADLTQIC